jgi:hypothetical protein
MTGPGNRVGAGSFSGSALTTYACRQRFLALARDDQTAMIEAIAAEIEDDGPVAATAPVPAPWA